MVEANFPRSTTNQKHYQDLGSASDWLEQIYLRNTTNQKHYQNLDSDTSSVWNLCVRSSTSLREETSGGVAKCRLYSQVKFSIKCGIVIERDCTDLQALSTTA